MWRRTTLKLTVLYSLIFIGFLVIFSGGLYVWVNSALGEGYVEQVRGQVEQNDKTETPARQAQTAQIAADIALDHFRNILLTVDGIGIILVPLGAYILTRRTLRPLVRSQEQQRQFIANASHELRTPLAVLNAELELALRKPHTASEYKKTLASSKQEVDHMTHLTNELLLLAQLDEKPANTPEKTIVNLHEILQDVQRQLNPQATRRSVTIRNNCPASISVHGSTMLITIALSNVIDNAIKHSKQGGEVSIQASTTSDNHALITISNQGPAIPVSQQSRLFDRFYQAQSSRNGDGFGLGLAITQKILSLHGGHISFTSSSDGTSFYIQL